MPNKSSKETMAEKTRYSASNLKISLLTEETDLSTFSCGNKELDSFFKKEVYLCQKYKYVSAYCVSDIRSKEIIALFTLSNDSVIINNEDDLSDFMETSASEMDDEYQKTFGKQTSFPAINIGHLAVSKNKQSMGVGQFIIDYIIAISLNFTIMGCQFITVDSLNNKRTNKFYSDNEFYYQTNHDMYSPTRRMYLPLLKYKK